MISKGRPSDVTDWTTFEISDAAILSYYFGIKKIPCLISSPLRRDKKPSFGLYSSDGKKVYFKDFSTGDHGGVFDLLKALWSCDYRTAWNRVKDDLGCYGNEAQIHASAPMPKAYVSVSTRSDSLLECKTRDWEPHDLEYWQSYGITKEWLEYAEVYPVSHKIVIKDGIKQVFGAEKYAYVFVEHKDGNTTLKLYQPFSTTFKWLNKHDGSVVSLWTKVPPDGPLIIICSSVKDALCVWANTGIPAIAPQSETTRLSDTAIKVLKEKYEKICILFDNDEAGLKAGESLAELTGFKNLVIQQFEGGKDISDFYKINGEKAFKKLINSFKILKL